MLYNISELRNNSLKTLRKNERTTKKQSEVNDMIIFPAKIERVDTVIVDGYSDRKTFEGAVKDFGRFIEKKFKNGEGQFLIDTIKDGISETNQVIVKAETSAGGYFFEVEEVPCATRCDNFGEMEYREANYYICMRFLK